MPVRIPPEKIDQLRSAADIVDIIGAVVPLKKRGKNFVGRCPFHTEKTPSFNVSPDRQMYHCFGCGVGGNVITFVMEYEKVPFVEAVRSLAERYGIALPEGGSSNDPAEGEQEQIYEACRTAALFFHHSLMTTGEGKLALEYFHHRKFSDQTIKAFGLGYAPQGWDAFLTHARQKGHSQEQLERAGLVRKRDDGTCYDYFRGRAMFPIFTPTGRVVGFGARKMREDDPLGKYINSPETPIYNKSRVLYGLFQAKEAMREHDFVVLVEGYADLISVFQAGIRNVVASSGTALTPEQIQLISRYTKNITIVYDADSAGSKAAMRGVDLILEQNLDVCVAPLPEGEDPDTFVKRFGGEAFQSLLGKAVSFVDFISQTFERQGKLATPEGQSHVVRTIVTTIAKMKDELKRDFYIKQVAEKYKIYESTLYRELEQQRRIIRPERGPLIADPVTRGDARQSTERVSAPEIPALEHDLVHAMLEGGPAVASVILEQVSLEDFAHPPLRALVDIIARRLTEGLSIDPPILIDEIDDVDVRRLVAELMFARYSLSRAYTESRIFVGQADARKVAADALVALRRRSIERRVEENQGALKVASQRGEDVVSYLSRHHELLRELKELESTGSMEPPPAPES